MGLNQITAKVIEDSINVADKRLTTFQLCYPRFVHAEFMTHRVFSRNASSSRAIPVSKMIEQVRDNPAMPVHWGKNQPGMQAREEVDPVTRTFLQADWRRAAQSAAHAAEQMNRYGAHKQVVNRILEPFQLIHVVVTATEWANFYELRDHEDADPNIHALARAMREAHDASVPVERVYDHYDQIITANAWHLPYVTEEERWLHFKEPWLLAMISAARCARVSYLKHDGTKPSMEEDIALYLRLVGSKPLHASPTEHAAHVASSRNMSTDPGGLEGWVKNFCGWVQLRFYIEERHHNLLAFDHRPQYQPIQEAA